MTTRCVRCGMRCLPGSSPSVRGPESVLPDVTGNLSLMDACGVDSRPIQRKPKPRVVADAQAGVSRLVFAPTAPRQTRPSASAAAHGNPSRRRRYHRRSASGRINKRIGCHFGFKQRFIWGIAKMTTRVAVGNRSDDVHGAWVHPAGSPQAHALVGPVDSCDRPNPSFSANADPAS
jgi:hypothetical protein